MFSWCARPHNWNGIREYIPPVKNSTDASTKTDKTATKAANTTAEATKPPATRMLASIINYLKEMNKPRSL
jgi:hypothetical protein